MKRMGVEGQSAKRRKGPLFATIIIGACLAAAVAMADTFPRCDEINRVIFELEQSGKPDSLVAMLALIDRAKSCEGNQSGTFKAWLSLKQTWGLDKLGRHGEAERETDRFFREDASEAPPRFRASMYLHRFRLRWLRGNHIGAVAAYHEGKSDFEALPPAVQTSSALDLAKVYIEVGANTEAHTRLNSVQPEPGTVEAGRVLVLRGLVALADSSFDQALPFFSEAVTLFDSLGIDERRAAALIGVGRSLDGLGSEGEALQALSRAIRLAKATHAHHVTIYGLYRRGVLYTHQERLDMAHGDLARASVVMDSAGLREHETVIATALGEMYVLKANRGAALAEFGRAITAGELRQDVETIRALRRAEVAALELALKDPPPKGIGWSWVLLIVSLTWVVGYKIGQWDRRRRAIDGLVMPRRRRNWTPLFMTRLECVFTVLTDPDEVLRVTDDPYIFELLKRDDIQMLAELYECAYAIEADRRGLTDEQRSDDPSNTYSAYFRKYFEEYTKEPVPRTVERWRLFFRV